MKNTLMHIGRYCNGKYLRSQAINKSAFFIFPRMLYSHWQGQWLSVEGAKINRKKWLPPQPWPGSDRVGIVECIPPLHHSRHDTGILVQRASSPSSWVNRLSEVPTSNAQDFPSAALLKTASVLQSAASPRPVLLHFCLTPSQAHSSVPRESHYAAATAAQEIREAPSQRLPTRGTVW